MFFNFPKREVRTKTENKKQKFSQYVIIYPDAELQFIAKKKEANVGFAFLNSR